MFIDKKSPIPAYFQLKNIILDKIKTSEYTENSLIPSERELSEVLGISRMTVRQALNQLVSEGILYREKGKGTFVSRSKIEQRNIMSFSDIVRKKGLTPNTQVLNFTTLKAEGDILNNLRLKNDEPVYNIKRLRLAGDLPIGIEEDFIPEMYCPNLEKYDLSASLYRILKERFGYRIKFADNAIEASKPLKEEKELLKLPSGIPVLRISSTVHTESGLKLLYERSLYRSDEYIYNVRVFENGNAE